ncbi:MULTISPECIES: NAD(P)H-dependent oxidoreductase [unclassified Shewanella]|uniref:NAD(P)H-dependent oxidoreductase n=1 Tax=unclassified Shewanella TaxID=196818 RepID=UPI00354B0A2E
MKIGVIFFSKTDVTGALATSLINGLSAFGQATIIKHQIKGGEIVEGRFTNLEIIKKLSSCDAIIFGTPTYMGGVSAQFKAFADATSELWCEQEWSGKLAAGFTSGSAMNGDQTGTLQYLVTLSNQHGMLWVGLDSAQGYKDHGINRLGCQLGVVAHSPDGNVNKTDLETAYYLGNRVFEQVLRMNPKSNKSSQQDAASCVSA